MDIEAVVCFHSVVYKHIIFKNFYPKTIPDQWCTFVKNIFKLNGIEGWNKVM